MRLAARSVRYDTAHAVMPMEGLMSSRLDHCKVVIVAVGDFIKMAGLGELRRVLMAEGARVGHFAARSA
ncbi:MAG: hypothetical protein GAK33_03755 [Burkholderia lata]|uniref:Uncharacterized protein n=1 Tax=Burkholderia lata (strain ATCC 17760 / DSM 23089 / LMG 22485 / NCIMB 9086 / R18194 / 383) TaxID=482957 RepID=A0A833V0K4_BURL3|nr:MAG: hypothetical protein GAK33_03755 [Burkholderia lata]